MKVNVWIVGVGALAAGLLVQRNRARAVCQRAVRERELAGGSSGAAAGAKAAAACGKTWRF